MGVNARRKVGGGSRQSSIVTELPVLPYPLYVGKITWQDNFDANVTGSIEYTGLTESDIDGVQNAYVLGNDLTLYGIIFTITRFSYTRELADTEEYEIDVYTATITIEGKELKLSDTELSRAQMLGFVSYGDRKAVSLVGELPTNGDQAVSQNQALQQKMYADLQIQQQLFYLNQQLVGATTREEKIGIQNAINNLQAKQETVKLTTVQPAQGVTFARTQIIADGGNEIVYEKEGFNNTEVTGGFSDGAQIQNAGDRTPLTFRLKEPKVETIREFSKDFDQPPENTYVLRDDTSQCFDDKGQKKVWKETVRINGQPESEIIRTKGFVYSGWDILTVDSDGNDVLYSANPTSFWTDIEERRTRYVYRRADPVRLSINVTDLGNEWVRVVMNPDYNQFASFGGGILVYQSRAEFLVEMITEGWQLVRFKKEGEAGADDTVSLRKEILDVLGGPIDAYTQEQLNSLYLSLEALSFRKIPFYSKTVYLLASPITTSGTKITPPFSIEYADYNTLEPKLKELFNKSELTNDGRVAIITPEINFVEPLYVKAEGSASNSFASMENPEYEDTEGKFIPGTNTPLPPKRLTTGEESWNETRRTIIDTNTYSEMVTEYSSQDPGFDNVIERITFRENSGSPPSPSYRMIEYEQVKTEPNQKQNGDGNGMKFVLNTPNAAALETGNSLSFPQAKTQEEARLAGEVALRKASMQAQRSQKTVFGFYPSLRCGQPVVFERDRYSSLGQWRLMTVQWELEYKGLMDQFGLLVTTPGTQLTLGLDKVNPVTISRQPNADTNPNNGSNGNASNPTADIQPSRIPGEMGDVLPVLQTRRNY